MSVDADHFVIRRIERFVMREQNLDEEIENNRATQKAAGQSQEKTEPHPQTGKPREQIPDGANPREERHDRREIDRRDLRARPSPVPHPHMAVMPRMVQTRDVQKASQCGNRAQYESNDETEKVEILPTHVVCSFKTCRRRSASPGVSRISASRMKHFLESA